MEGPIAQGLASKTGITFAGEGKGSKALANLIADGLRRPDIFISADPALVKGLGNRVASSVTFGHATMVLAWSPNSPRSAQLAQVAAGTVPLIEALRTPGLRIARTDPRLDPKGERTIRAVRLLAGNDAESTILGADSNPAQIFPEEDLLVRLESGDADVAFLYSTEARSRKLPFVELPGKAALADEITYTIAIMRDAPNPRAAQAFEEFVLRGDGKRILEAAGVQYRLRQ
jgi:molybdate/tungstate transport system substrate-binding protein